MPDQPHEERAAMESAMNTAIGDGHNPIVKARYAFEVGWQARGAYEREQVEQAPACGNGAPGVRGLVCVLGPGHAGLHYSRERYGWHAALAETATEPEEQR